jgi:hypothetical protein
MAIFLPLIDLDIRFSCTTRRGLLAGMNFPSNSERVVWRMALPPGFEQAEHW